MNYFIKLNYIIIYYNTKLIIIHIIIYIEYILNYIKRNFCSMNRSNRKFTKKYIFLNTKSVQTSRLWMGTEGKRTVEKCGELELIKTHTR